MSNLKNDPLINFILNLNDEPLLVWSVMDSEGNQFIMDLVLIIQIVKHASVQSSGTYDKYCKPPLDVHNTMNHER